MGGRKEGGRGEGRKGRKRWFVVFTDFPGVNISTMSDLLTVVLGNAVYNQLLRAGLSWLSHHCLSFYLLVLLLLSCKMGVAFLVLPFQK